MKRLLIIALALGGVLAAGCIVRFGTLYEDAGSNTHFVALASNLTKADIVVASVQVDFFDSSNRLIATEFASPCTRTLQHQSDSPVEVILPTGVTVNHVQTTLRPITFGTKTVPDLEVNNVAESISGDTTHITGDIDVGNKDLFQVQVCLALLNGDDEVVKVGRVFTDPSNINNDNTGTFDIAVESDSDATQYEIWVDAVTHNPNDVTAAVVEGPNDLADLITATPTRTRTPTPCAGGTCTPTPSATPTLTATTTLTPNP
jgi:hypothetical protein